MFMCYCPSLFAKRLKKCKIKLSVLILSQYDLFLNTIKLKKCVVKLLILVFCISVSDQYKTQEICDRVVPEDPFMLIYCPDR